MSRCHYSDRFRSDDGNCSELAPGLMFDDFLPIPDAESLPFYPLVLKPVVRGMVERSNFFIIQIIYIYLSHARSKTRSTVLVCACLTNIKKLECLKIMLQNVTRSINLLTEELRVKF